MTKIEITYNPPIERVDENFDKSEVAPQNTGFSNQFKKILANIGSRKSLALLQEESETGELSRNLSLLHLICMGVGIIIGSGIFVYSGLVAANNAGPGVVLCFIIAGFSAALSALSYSELAASIPIAGSAYTFTYAAMGELAAWMTGWLILMEYAVGTAAVTVGWSGYLKSFFQNAFSVTLNNQLTGSPVEWSEQTNSFLITGNYINLPAFLLCLLVTGILILGTKQSAMITIVAVSIKVGIILVFVFGCCSFVDTGLWSPFIPDSPPDAIYGKYGFTGILKGSSIIFFCYIGFDAVSTLAQETKNPGRDIPLGIIGSLTISTALYIAVCLVLVGLVPYYKLNVPKPISLAVESTGMIWLAAVIDFSAVIGILTTVIMQMLGQSRTLYAMSRDNLLPKSVSKIHPRFKTPYIAQIIIGVITSIMAGLLPIDLLGELSGVGTLTTFMLVNINVIILRKRYPDMNRPFKVPFGPYLIPLLGSIISGALVLTSSPVTISRLAVWLALGFLVYFSYGYRHSKLRHSLIF